MSTTQARVRETSADAETLRLLAKRLLRPAHVRLRKIWVGSVFDRRYGVHTEDHVDLRHLGLEAPGRVSYVPTGRHVLPAVLSRRDVTDRDVFLDAGSGMGRVVLQAALKYPLRRVIGVELAAELHHVAVRNLERNRHRLRAADVELTHCDIGRFEIPDDVTIVFLYNPFKGQILRDFASRLVESVDRAPRRVRVLYVNPEDEESLTASGRMLLARRRRAGRWRVHEYDVQQSRQAAAGSGALTGYPPGARGRHAEPACADGEA